MRDKKVIQFTHPLHQHKISYKNGDLKTEFPNIFIKSWNSKNHHRKYIRTRGKYITSLIKKDKYIINEGNIDFWGEWEAESVAQKLKYNYHDKYKDQYPKYIHYPFYTDWRKYKNKSDLQNTDPFVFDKKFYYTCYKQNQTKNLGIGSIILFGSRPEIISKKENIQYEKQYYGKFIVDTVFVVKNIEEYNIEKIEKYNNEDNHMFYNCVLHKIYYGHDSNEKNIHKTYRRYEGSTIEDNNDMFSFFPCKESSDKGECRLEIDTKLHSSISTKLMSTNYIIANGTEKEIKEFWDKLVMHTLNKGYYLGINTEKPRYFDDIEEVRKNPYTIIVSTLYNL